MGRLSQSEKSIVIKCDRYSRYYQVIIKVRQVFHSAIGITKWDDYYKVRQVLL